MVHELDILTIDADVRKNFDKELIKLPHHRQKLQELDQSLKKETLRRRVRCNLIKARDELIVYIKELQMQKNFHFYVMETLPLIEEYREILKTPVKISFMGKTSKNDKQKQHIVEKYLDVASKYVDIEIEKDTSSRTIGCLNCPNRKEFDVIDCNTYVCTRCYTRQVVMKHASSYNDIDRVNISSKYMYDPKIHFRDCIKQYQGKQNCTIPQQIYDDLEQQFERHHLLNGDGDTAREVRFKKITKTHIMIFLKELNYSKHYENLHLL